MNIIRSYIGIDFSLNHFGICCITEDANKLINWSYLTDKKKYKGSNFSGPNYRCTAYYLDGKEKGEDRGIFLARRRSIVYKYLTDFLHHICPIYHTKRRGKYSAYVCMEDVVYTTRTNSSYELSELVGLVKNYLWDQGFCLRLLAPGSLKLWATGKGSALKKDMVWFVEKTLGEEVDLSFLGKLMEYRKRKRKGKEPLVDLDGPGTDIVEAYLMALFVEQELMVRDGLLDLEDLAEHQRNVFLRTTPAHPVNILATPFIHKGEVNE